MRYIYIATLLWMTLVQANSVEAEIGINVGVTSTKNELGSAMNNKTVSATLQFNNYVVMPRFDLEYVNISNNQVSSLLKGSFNGVYEFENDTVLTPYIIGGVGYEDVRGGIKDVFESHPFVHAGGGLVYSTPNQYDMKARVEGKMLQIIGGSKGEENEASLIAGITVPVPSFSPKSQPKAPVAKPAVKQMVHTASVQPRKAPLVTYKNECSIKISAPDLDRDGVENRFDQCPNTPCNFAVDIHGCPTKTTLQINFASNSAEIDRQSIPKVVEFAQILLRNKGSYIQILGYTDSRGSASKNLLLSHRRAKSVMSALIDMGVSASRIHAEGRGESMPIASNKTSCGRKSNRRIEAVLSYPKGV